MALIPLGVVPARRCVCNMRVWVRRGRCLCASARANVCVCGNACGRVVCASFIARHACVRMRFVLRISLYASTNHTIIHTGAPTLIHSHSNTQTHPPTQTRTHTQPHAHTQHTGIRALLACCAFHGQCLGVLAAANTRPVAMETATRPAAGRLVYRVLCA